MFLKSRLKHSFGIIHGHRSCTVVAWMQCVSFDRVTELLELTQIVVCANYTRTQLLHVCLPW